MFREEVSCWQQLLVLQCLWCSFDMFGGSEPCWYGFTRLCFSLLAHLLCAFRHGSISSDGSTDTGCGDAGRSDIPCWICAKGNKTFTNKAVYIFTTTTPLPPSWWPLWWVNYVSRWGWKAIKAVTFVNHWPCTPQRCLLLQDEACQHFTESTFRGSKRHFPSSLGSLLCGEEGGKKKNYIQRLRLLLAWAESRVATFCSCSEE